MDPATSWEKVPEDVKEWIRSALRDRPVRFPWYWFGPVGSGKSSAAALVYQCAPEEVELDNGERVSCTPFAFRLDDLVQMIKKARKGGAEMIEGNRSFLRSEATIFKMLRRASVVLIDEVAQRKEKSDAFERDRAIVDKIADQLQFCRTILTSNVAPKKREPGDTSATLMDIYDARIASRLLANGVAREFAGARMRNSKLRVEFKEGAK